MSPAGATSRPGQENGQQHPKTAKIRGKTKKFQPNTVKLGVSVGGGW